MFKKLQEKAGFISLETIVVAGVVLALAVYALTEYNTAGKGAIDAGIDKINRVLVELP